MSDVNGYTGEATVSRSGERGQAGSIWVKMDDGQEEIRVEFNKAGAVLFASLLVEAAGPYDGVAVSEMIAEFQRAAMRSTPEGSGGQFIKD